MEPNNSFIPEEEWEIIVRNVPIVSVDLVITVNNGIALGKRQKEPAKGEWFVPGGRVKKNESLTSAVHRVAQEEIGVPVDILESLGAYEHFYDESETNDSGGKHYLANGFHVEAQSEEFSGDDQHSEIKIFEEVPMNAHEYVQLYLKDAGLLDVDLSDSRNQNP